MTFSITVNATMAVKRPVYLKCLILELQLYEISDEFYENLYLKYLRRIKIETFLVSETLIIRLNIVLNRKTDQIPLAVTVWLHYWTFSFLRLNILMEYLVLGP